MAYRVLTLHFWPIIKIGDPLDPNFGRIFSRNIFNCQEDPLGIILSPYLGGLDSVNFTRLWMTAYRFFILSQLSKLEVLCTQILGKNINGYILNYQDGTLGII